jgi:hypothetical protein
VRNLSVWSENRLGSVDGIRFVSHEGLEGCTEAISGGDVGGEAVPNMDGAQRMRSLAIGDDE